MHIKEVGKVFLPGAEGKSEVFEEVQMSRMEFRDFFPKIKINVFFKYNIFINEDKIIINLKNSPFGKISSLVLFPWFCVTDGFHAARKDLSDIWRDVLAWSVEFSSDSQMYKRIKDELEYQNTLYGLNKEKKEYGIISF